MANAISNGFSKEERVAFDQVLEGFQDAVIATKLAHVYKTDQVSMERSGNQIWRPQPYIMPSFQAAPGTDMTANFNALTQLSVPASITTQDTVPFSLNALQLRDQLQEGRLGESAKQKIASDINVGILNTAVAYGSVVIKQTVAASGFSDVALIDSTMDVLGIGDNDRKVALSPSDYNNMAANLASRNLYPNNKSEVAYEKAFLGQIASIKTFKLNYGKQLAASPGTVVTVNQATNYYVPTATSLQANGVYVNQDNRFQTMTWAWTTAPAVGDCFTFANVHALHHITKQSTGSLKTFRITAINGNNVTFTPPIISNGGGSTAEAQYQNVDAAPANGSPITFLNDVTGYANPFWEGETLEILPGRLVIPTDAGVAVMRGTTDDGLELVMTKWVNGFNQQINYRFDSLYGFAYKNPELGGVILFSQT